MVEDVYVSPQFVIQIATNSDKYTLYVQCKPFEPALELSNISSRHTLKKITIIKKGQIENFINYLV